MIEQAKEHPIKYAISAVTLISMLIGGVLAVDSRYAKAGDLMQQQQYFEQSTKDTRKAIDRLRIYTLADKIFEIELIPEDKRTQADKARIEKYKRDIREIELSWEK